MKKMLLGLVFISVMLVSNMAMAQEVWDENNVEVTNETMDTNSVATQPGEKKVAIEAPQEKRQNSEIKLKTFTDITNNPWQLLELPSDLGPYLKSFSDRADGNIVMGILIIALFLFILLIFAGNRAMGKILDTAVRKENVVIMPDQVLNTMYFAFGLIILVSIILPFYLTSSYLVLIIPNLFTLPFLIALIYSFWKLIWI